MLHKCLEMRLHGLVEVVEEVKVVKVVEVVEECTRSANWLLVLRKSQL